MKSRITKWLGLLLIGLTGCYDYSNFDNVAVDQFSPAYVFPLINSTITFKDLAEKAGTNSVVEQRPGSNMYFLTYRDTIDLGLASALFVIPPVTFNDNFVIPGGLIPPIFPVNTTIALPPQTYNQTYNSIVGAELKRIDLLGGTLEVNLTNTFNHSFNGTLTIASLKNASGTPVSINFTLSSAGTFNNSIPITGYYLDLLDLPSNYNNIKYSVAATIISSGDPSLAGNIGIQLSINSPEYQQITGKITYSYAHDDQTYAIGLFKSTIIADQHIAEPKFTLNIINSFGLPSKVNFTRFEVEKNSTPKIVSITHDGANNPGDLLIGSLNPLKNATASKQSDTTKLKLTSTNSNIEDLFDGAPNSISFGATFDIGNAADPSHDYFVKNDSKFRLQSEIEIPLTGWVVTNEIADTIANVDWPDFKKDLKLTHQRFRLKFKFNNGLPLNMYLQIKFLDTNGALVSQLFDAGSEQLIKSSPVNPVNGESTGKTIAYSYITIDEAKYNQMALSQDMVIIFKFTTGGTLKQNITILSSDAIGVEMSLEASGTVKL